MASSQRKEPLRCVVLRVDPLADGCATMGQDEVASQRLEDPPANGCERDVVVFLWA
jgi:hypothetical protein